jgi:translation initiation factor 4A
MDTNILENSIIKEGSDIAESSIAEASINAYKESKDKTADKVSVVERWDDYDLKPDLLRGIYSYGFEAPSQIQKTAILPILQKRDLIAQAPSGTGKTGAFTIGSLHHVDTSVKSTQILILAPTHELVNQIAGVVESIGASMDGLIVKTLVGGTPVSDDTEMIRNSVPHVVVGTVGRVCDMIRRRILKINTVKMLVMDEADEMLSTGFKDQIYNIFQYFNKDLQIALFSATLPDEILAITKRFMRNPVKITLQAEKLNLEGIQQYYVALDDDRSKFEMLKTLFAKLSISQCIIYANSVPRVVDLYNAMMADGFAVCCIHSAMSKEQRTKSFTEFRLGTHRVMISSNATARGIDVQQVSVVINFDIPTCQHTYLHRIGRSGRWGRKGVAINFITRQDVGTMKFIENYYKASITELPADYTTV